MVAWRELEPFPFAFPPHLLNLDHTLASGQVFRWQQDGAGRWIGVVGDRAIRLGQEGSRFVFQSYPPPPDATNVARWMEDYFRLAVDLAALYREWSAVDRDIARAISRFPGLRIVRQDPTECLLSYVCSTANSIPRISSAVSRLSALLGAPLGVVDGMAYHAFPGPERIAAADPEALADATGLEWRAARLVTAASGLITRPAGWRDGLRDADYREARAALITLPGVGAKIADCVCLFALGKDEAVPVDRHVWALAGRLFLPDLQRRSLTTATYERVANAFRERYGPYAGWAQEYLFYEDVLRGRKKLD